MAWFCLGLWIGCIDFNFIGKNPAMTITRRQAYKAISLAERYSVGPFRMSGRDPQLQTLPKSAYVGVDYGTIERTVMAVYPGEDGIGADVTYDSSPVRED